MRISTRSRHAISAMLELAIHNPVRAVSLLQISRTQGISLSYLEQIFAALRAKKLVRGVRGPGGGYFIAQPIDEITIADVICAVDEWVEYTRRRSVTSSVSDAISMTAALWEELSDDLYRFLEGVTIADLIGGRSSEIGTLLCDSDSRAA